MHWFKRFLLTLILSAFFGLVSLGSLVPPTNSAQLVVLGLGIASGIPFCWYMRRQLAKPYVPMSPETKQRGLWLMGVGMAVLSVLSRVSPSAKDWVNLSMLVFSLAAFIAFVYTAFYLVWHRPPPA